MLCSCEYTNLLTQITKWLHVVQLWVHQFAHTNRKMISCAVVSTPICSFKFHVVQLWEPWFAHTNHKMISCFAIESTPICSYKWQNDYMLCSCEYTNLLTQITNWFHVVHLWVHQSAHTNHKMISCCAVVSTPICSQITKWLHVVQLWVHQSAHTSHKMITCCAVVNTPICSHKLQDRFMFYNCNSTDNTNLLTKITKWLCVVQLWIHPRCSHNDYMLFWFVCFDSLHPSQQFSSCIWMGLPGLNQY